MMRMARAIEASPWIPQVPTVKQLEFIASPVKEKLYGGAAGGGKSSAILMDAALGIEFPDYAAVIFRKTYADLSLPNAIMDRSLQWWSDTDAHWDDKKKSWTFPSGARINFAYLRHESDKYRYKSAEFQFCWARGTPILMADDTYKAIEDVAVGDYVATLKGPRRVTQTHRPGMRPVVEVLTAQGVRVLAGSGHRVLSARGWVSGEELLSTVYDGHAGIPIGSAAISQATYTPDGSLCQDARQGSALHTQNALRTPHQVTACCSGGGVDTHQIYVPLVLFERALGLSAQLLPRLVGQAYSQASSFLYDYRHGYRYGERHAHGAVPTVQGSTPLPTAAGVCGFAHHDADGPRHTQVYSHKDSLQYCHPYSYRMETATEHTVHSLVQISPAGEAEVLDLTIDDASHYITAGGIVAQNCGFDELTQFPKSQYNYLKTRLRRVKGMPVPPHMSSASNPGDIGHEWVYEEFVKGTHPQKAFFPALITDNPHLNQAEYEENLQDMDETTRNQLLRGIWVADESGNPFKREYWRRKNRFAVFASPDEDELIVGRWISWDTALKDTQTSAYNACVVFELLADYRLRVSYVWREKLTFPELLPEIERIASLWNWDGKLRGVIIEDKASGTTAYQTLKDSADYHLSSLLQLFNPGQSPKEVRWSQAAIWCKRDCIELPNPSNDVPWLYDFEAELFAVPKSEYKDQADAFAQGVIYLEALIADGYHVRNHTMELL